MSLTLGVNGSRTLGSFIARGGPPGEAPRTWADLICASERLRARLAGLGWREPVVACGDRFFLLSALLALWSDGRRAVLPSNNRPETIQALLDSGAADGLLHGETEEGRAGLNVVFDCAARPDEDCGVAMSMRVADVLSWAGDEPLVTIYSSGSTGAPVASLKTARQLFGEARALVDAFGLGAGSRVLSSAPPHHIYGLLFSVLTPVFAGGSFVRQTPVHAQAIAGLAADHGADVLCAVPPHLQALQALDPGSLTGLRRVFCSGSSLAPGVAGGLRERLGLRVTEVLGSSETGGIAWRLADAGPEWTPLPGVDVAADADGVMLIDSPFLSPAPEAPRPRRAADRVEMTTNGRFRHLGRSDGIVKVAGERVALLEIERKLLTLDGVSDAVVLALDDPGPRRHEICAAVVAPGLSAPELRRALSRWFEPIALPRRFRFVERLPREETGKLQRARLRSLFDVAPVVETREGPVEGP